MLLAVHTDKEFTKWLQRHAEDGWWLRENRGNIFVFIKKPYAGKRICSYTVRSDALNVPAEDAFYDLQDGLRLSGWNLLAMGMPEHFIDKSRHAFLAEAPRDDLPHPEIPLSDPAGQIILLRAALKKALSTLALCLLFATVLIFFPIYRPGQLFTGIPGTVFLALMGAVISVCGFNAVKATSLYAKSLRDPGMDSSDGDFQSLDRAVILSFVMMGIFAVYLILDLLI